MVKEKPAVALVDASNGKSVEAVDKVGLETEVGPTEIPGEENVSTTSKGMIKPTAQPRMGYMSVSKRDEMTRQGDLAGALPQASQAMKIINWSRLHRGVKGLVINPDNWLKSKRMLV
jgi:hypothetical protein